MGENVKGEGPFGCVASCLKNRPITIEWVVSAGRATVYQIKCNAIPLHLEIRKKTGRRVISEHSGSRRRTPEGRRERDVVGYGRGVRDPA